MVRTVSDPHVWRSVRLLYMGSGALFLATVLLGILNVFTSGEIPRGQILAHFHSGSIGWVTLSVLATTIWLFTGERSVSDGYRKSVLWLAWVGIIAVAGYILAFYLAFNGDGMFWMLPLFGIPTALVILGGLVLAATQFSKLPVASTAHLLMLGALIVAGLGATMGILVGLAHADVVDVFPVNDDADAVGAHAGPMDMYLALAFGAIAELLLRGDSSRWSKPAMAQMILGVTSGFVVSLALFVGIGALIPVGMLLFLVSFGFYFARTGWRVFPMGPRSRPALWWGGVAFPFYIGLFVYAVMAYFSQGKIPPPVLAIVFVHTTFVAMATNLVLSVQSHFASGSVMPRNTAIGIWVLNGGLLAFFAGEIMAEVAHGALLMAAGVLMALWLIWNALRLASAPSASRKPA